MKKTQIKSAKEFVLWPVVRQIAGLLTRLESIKQNGAENHRSAEPRVSTFAPDTVQNLFFYFQYRKQIQVAVHFKK